MGTKDVFEMAQEHWSSAQDALEFEFSKLAVMVGRLATRPFLHDQTCGSGLAVLWLPSFSSYVTHAPLLMVPKFC